MEQPTELIYDTVVLGAGVSGLIALEFLSSGKDRICCLEEYHHIGGNHITDTVNEMEFDVGSIYFSPPDAQFKHFPELQKICISKSLKRIKLRPDGVFSNYPIAEKADIWSMGLPFLARAASSIIYSRIRFLKSANAAEKVKAKLGAFFFIRSGLNTYMERLFSVPPYQISSMFVEKRMIWVMNYSVMTILARFFRKAFSGSSQTNTPYLHLFRPRGGFASYYAGAQKQLEACGVEFKHDSIQEIERIENGAFRVRLNSGICLQARRIISTLPLKRIAILTGLAPPNLEAVNLLSLYVTLDGYIKNDADIIFNFQTESHWKRITVYSNVYGKVCGKHYMTIECPFHPEEEIDIEAVFQSVKTHLADSEVTIGDLHFVGHRILSEAYPILKLGHEEELNRFLGQLEELKIETIGRQGRFDYLPHSTVVAEHVKNKLDRNSQSSNAG